MLVPRPWTEGFTTTPLPGWNGNGVWNVGNPTGMSTTSGPMAYTIQYSASAYELTSIPVGPVLGSDIFQFDYKVAGYYSPYGPVPIYTGVLKVYLSNNFGDTYTLLDSLAYPTDTLWHTFNYNLTSYANQKLKIKVIASFFSPSFIFCNIGVDNFLIGPPPCTNPIVNLGADTTICEGQTLGLNAGTSNANYTKLWSTTDTGQSINVNTSGTYHLTVTNGACITKDTIVVTVAPLPIVNLGNDTNICNGGPYTLNAGGSASNTFLWSNNATSQSISVANSGTYSVTVTNAQGCQASDTIDIYIGNIPTANGITSTGASPTFQFSVNNPQYVDSFKWSFGDGGTSILQNPSHTYTPGTTSQTYTVTLIIKNDCGADTFTTSIIVAPNGIKHLNLDDQSLKIYPNPATHKITLENASNYVMKNLEIINVLGQQVLNTKVDNNNKQEININKLPAGLYNVKIEFDGGVVTRKLEILK